MARMANALPGSEGFHPIGDLTVDEPHYDWQAQISAVIGLLVAKGYFNVHDFRDAIERIDPATYLGLGYYERWVEATPKLLIEKAGLDVEIPEEFHDH